MGSYGRSKHTSPAYQNTNRVVGEIWDATQSVEVRHVDDRWQYCKWHSEEKTADREYPIFWSHLRSFTTAPYPLNIGEFETGTEAGPHLDRHIKGRTRWPSRFDS